MNLIGRIRVGNPKFYGHPRILPPSAMSLGDELRRADGYFNPVDVEINEVPIEGPEKQIRIKVNCFDRQLRLEKFPLLGVLEAATVVRGQVHLLDQKVSSRKDKAKAYQKKDSGSSRKYPVKSYIAEGKSWDDTDDEEEQYGNLALMAESSSQVTFPTIRALPPDNLCENEHCVAFRQTVLVYGNAISHHYVKARCNTKECFEQHDVVKEVYRNVSTTLRCTLLDVEDLKVELKKVKDENDKLVLDRKLIADQVVGVKVGIGLDYDELRKASKKRVVENEPVEKVVNPPSTPHVLKEAKKPLSKKATIEPFDEDNLYIHHEMLVEDLELSRRQKAKKPTSVPSDSDLSFAGLGFISKNKKNRSRNGRIGTNGPRKLCNNCGSAGHLTHACRKHVSKNTGRSKTVSPPKARKVAPVTKPKSKSVGASESDKETVNDKAKTVKPVNFVKKIVIYSNASKSSGPNVVWVPKKT
ncbi:hypothetical protein AgCh_022117 [Apium graveolens]